VEGVFTVQILVFFEGCRRRGVAGGGGGGWVGGDDAKVLTILIVRAVAQGIVLQDGWVIVVV
jgi:hypothetical protein